MASFAWLCLAQLMVYPVTSIAYPSYTFISGGHYPVHSFDSLLDATKALVDPLLLGTSLDSRTTATCSERKCRTSSLRSMGMGR